MPRERREPVQDLVELTDDGQLRLHFHKGQLEALDSEARCTAVIAGSQSGKTTLLPWWLRQEIEREGPGDYLMAGPTYQLMEKKAIPEFRRVFEDLLELGRFQRSPTMKFTFSREGCEAVFGEWSSWMPPTQVFFGYARNPDSLESATYKAAVLDEAGQNDFKQGSWEAIQRRLALNDGRTLIGTTPYNLGWLKTLIHDPWQRGDPDFKVVRFDSTANPMFPRHVFERARLVLPPWRFRMFYEGIFDRPAGQIYDSFDSNRHVVPTREIPWNWPRYVGLDFGQVNTAAVFFAAEPGTKRLWAYKEYGPVGGRTAEQHVAAMLRGEPLDEHTHERVRIRAVGGAPSEDEWRREFLKAGFYVGRPRVHEVEVGIDRVWGAHARNEILVMAHLERYLAQKASYARQVDDQGEPEEEIAEKAKYHLMDAERYVVSELRGSPIPEARERPIVRRGAGEGRGARGEETDVHGHRMARASERLPAIARVRRG